MVWVSLGLPFRKGMKYGVKLKRALKSAPKVTTIFTHKMSSPRCDGGGLATREGSHMLGKFPIYAPLMPQKKASYALLYVEIELFLRFFLRFF